MIAIASRLAAAMLAFGALCQHAQAVVPTRYVITDLGALPSSGASFSIATGINDHGWVSGYSFNGSGQRAILWTPQGGLQDLGSLSGGASVAYGINNSGHVIGWTSIPSGSSHSFIWRPNSGMQDLGGGTTYLALNDQGTIVGTHLLVSNQPIQAFPANFQATAINNKGQIAGVKTIGNTAAPVYLLDNGQLVEQPLLDPNAKWAYAADINEHGDIVGSSTSLTSGAHAVLWRNGQVIDLGDFAGGVDLSRAQGINDAGLIVGYGNSGPSSDFPRAALWDTDGTLYDLTDLLVPGSGWSLAEAAAINNRGQIVGKGVNALGQSRAFLLTPVPEPQTMALWLAGGVIVGRHLYRRRRDGQD